MYVFSFLSADFTSQKIARGQVNATHTYTQYIHNTSLNQTTTTPMIELNVCGTSGDDGDKSAVSDDPQVTTHTYIHT